MTREEEEAELFLQSLEQNQNPTTTSLYTDEDYEEDMIKKNQSIIDFANEILIDRLSNGDGSLQVKDLVSLKMESFKQNQILKGRGENTQDFSKLIPTQINIQIINNN